MPLLGAVGRRVIGLTVVPILVSSSFWLAAASLPWPPAGLATPTGHHQVTEVGTSDGTGSFHALAERLLVLILSIDL
jgi:hypothetical protein